MRYFVITLLPLVCFALSFALWPALGRWRPFGLLPLPWLVLGPIVLFGIVGLAFVHEREAKRIEDEWARTNADRRRPSGEKRSAADAS